MTHKSKLISNCQRNQKLSAVLGELRPNINNTLPDKKLIQAKLHKLSEHQYWESNNE